MCSRRSLRNCQVLPMQLIAMRSAEEVWMELIKLSGANLAVQLLVLLHQRTNDNPSGTKSNDAHCVSRSPSAQLPRARSWQLPTRDDSC